MNDEAVNHFRRTKPGTPETRSFFIFLLGVVSVVLSVNTVFSQEPSYPELAIEADLFRAFNRSHTYIGIPTGDYVYTYAQYFDITLFLLYLFRHEIISMLKFIRIFDMNIIS